MEFSADTPRVARVIGAKEGPSFTVQVPTPFAAGQALTLTDGLANILNQTIAENLSNNLRAKLIAGKPSDTEGQPATPFTAEEAQAMVDAYLADYEPGTRRTGTGAPRVTDPIEREMRKLATDIAKAAVTQAGRKWNEVDKNTIIDAVLAKHGADIRKRAEQIVKAQQAATAAAGDGLDFDSLVGTA